jgi:hypothetical protein
VITCAMNGRSSPPDGRQAGDHACTRRTTSSASDARSRSCMKSHPCGVMPSLIARSAVAENSPHPRHRPSCAFRVRLFFVAWASRAFSHPRWLFPGVGLPAREGSACWNPSCAPGLRTGRDTRRRAGCALRASSPSAHACFIPLLRSGVCVLAECFSSVCFFWLCLPRNSSSSGDLLYEKITDTSFC